MRLETLPSTLSQNEQEALEALAVRLRRLLGTNFISLRLFGSKARGEATMDSDIDLLLTVKELDLRQKQAIYEIVLDVDLEYDAKISLKVFAAEELARSQALGSPFVESLDREGIILAARS